jgi:hypothetical protein|tara:strand:- start:4544 stop:4753 length:210 start_codon:yes stop_codon:yes gene_type:complete
MKDRDYIEYEAGDYFAHNPDAKECAFVLLDEYEVKKVKDEEPVILEYDNLKIVPNRNRQYRTNGKGRRV